MSEVVCSSHRIRDFASGVGYASPRERDFASEAGYASSPERRRVRGSYTVEAAFVVPIVVWVFIVVIYGALYLHDVTVTKATVETIATEGAAFVAWDVIPGGTETLYEHKLAGSVFRRMLRDGLSEAEDYLRSYASRKVGNGLLIANASGFNVSISDDSVTVSVLVSGSRSGIVNAFLPGILFRKNIKVTEELNDNTTWNRLVCTTVRTGLKVKGAREVCEKLDLILGRLGK